MINASVYRDGADNKFKVLEIQPDYPIDLEVAALNQTVETAYKTEQHLSQVTIIQFLQML